MLGYWWKIQIDKYWDIYSKLINLVKKKKTFLNIGHRHANESIHVPSFHKKITAMEKQTPAAFYIVVKQSKCCPTGS